MNLSESFRIALNSLSLNRLRAILTALGIVIGVAAVVTLVSLGRGVQAYVASSFFDLGASTLTISSSEPESDARTEVRPLTLTDVNDLANPAIAPSVQAVTAQYSLSAQMVFGSNSVQLSVAGVMPNYDEINNWYVRPGMRFITQADIENRERVVVLGVSTVEDLFGDKNFNPVSLPVEINGGLFTVVGVMEEFSAGGFEDVNAVGFIPITTAQTRLDNARVRGGNLAVSEIQVKIASSEYTEAATAEIETYLNNAHEIDFVGEEDYTISSPGDFQESLNLITSALTIFLGVVAGISLLVGGIGIMNIMLVSVTERTREIGLRKAVGARGGDILGQFLIESVVLSIIGGALGIGISWVLLVIAGVLIPDLDLALTLDAALLATGVSTVVGVFFGLYPASRAARMRPIDALRFE